jgi:hypothetical protein
MSATHAGTYTSEFQSISVLTAQSTGTASPLGIDLALPDSQSSLAAQQSLIVNFERLWKSITDAQS